MLENYKKQYLNSKVQFILTDPGGRILESDQMLFKVSPGEAVFDLHPFFLCLIDYLENPSSGLTYTCVHLEFGKKKLICDIDIHLSEDQKQLVIVIHDLSDHYLSYQTLAQARNESIIKSELVTLKNIELEEREKFKNNFIVNFSHELRTPLTNIISFANLLGKTSLTNEQIQYIKLIQDSNSNLKLMLEDILNINRIASGKLNLQKKLFNLYDLLEVLRLTYGHKAANKGLDFVLELDENIPEFVEGDRLRINQVLINLLENAIKYTQKGSIHFKVKLNQKRAFKANIHFEVSDSGIGIPEDQLDTIFESFTQLNPKGSAAGTGLGLTIVKGLLTLMGSEIKVKNNKEKGTTFYFDINLKYPIKSLEKSLKTNKKITEKGPTIIPGDKKFRLLLVEDDENNQMILFKTLVETHHFYIDLINDGEKVLEEVVENEFDIILMDINLPNIQGHMIAKMIRELPFKELRKIPIIGITANAFPEDIKAYKKAGMNDVILKPFDEKALLNTIYKRLK
ncbi:response regulator [Leptobacterium flavescens]|uniref:histidine kinase n=1 Tax=Leptobacterium flavescens TaxID=472055 RepID=A0A6P0UI21_9FLAO|nr:ATP-binding protein [Leptobacterium flavescens]NER12935.1 response regulator [Leptobacterium flavescens]